MSILQIKANDTDASYNGHIHYTFEGGDDGDKTFALDPTSGVLRTAHLLDRETVPRYTLIALAVDDGDPHRSYTVSITVDLNYINDNAPLFDKDHKQLYIAENSPIGSTVREIRAGNPDAGRNAIILNTESPAELTRATFSWFLTQAKVGPTSSRVSSWIMNRRKRNIAWKLARRLTP